MVFGMVVAEVFGTWAPVDQKLALTNAILNPVKMHVHCFGAFLFDGVVGETGSG